MSQRPPRWSECTALFGGRFDPPHLGHEQALEGLFETPGVSRVLVVPSGNPPHKSTAASNEARLELAKEAFKKPGRARPVEILDDEIERTRLSGCPGYAWDTLQALKGTYGDSLAFVIGADQLRDLPQWHRFPEILGLCHWIVLERQPDGQAVVGEAIKTLIGSGLLRPKPEWSTQGLPALEVSHSPGRTLLVCPTKAPAVSSTDIRERLARGERPETLPISPEVALRLKSLKLYGTGH